MKKNIIKYTAVPAGLFAFLLMALVVIVAVNPEIESEMPSLLQILWMSACSFFISFLVLFLLLLPFTGGLAEFLNWIKEKRNT